jgi:cytochrome P450
LATPQSALDEISRDFGPVCSLGRGPLRMAVVGSPALIRDVLMRSNDQFRWGSRLSPFPFVVGRESMLVSDGDDHRRRRGAVSEAFSRRRLNRWIPMIVEQADATVDRLLAVSGDRPVDVYPHGRRLLIEIIVRALFGQRLVTHTAEIDAGFQRLQDYLDRPLWRHFPHRIPFTLRAGVRRDRQALDALVARAIAESRRGYPPAGTGPGDGGDVLDALVHRSDLSDREIQDQVKSLIGAGYDTTASSLAWILLEATRSPGLWDRLGAEAEAVFGSADAGTRPDDAALLTLTAARNTMRETLRMHPASGVAAREAVVDLELGGHTVPRHTIILWSPYLAGRDPDAWVDPETFRPDRFLEVNERRQQLANEAWVPFGRGPRMCVGFALAQMELTLIVARLAQRLELTAVSPTLPPPRGLIVSRPEGGAVMHVRRRSTPAAAAS